MASIAAARHITPEPTAPILQQDKLAIARFRGYEAEYVGSLWHWDCVIMRIEEGAHRARRVDDADPVRRAR